MTTSPKVEEKNAAESAESVFHISDAVGLLVIEVLATVRCALLLSSLF